MEQVFTNGQVCKAKIIESIASATKDIRVAMAFFTDRDIANELLKSKDKGVDVSVILSNDAYNETVKSILTPKCKVFVHKANGRGIMHHKFCLVDNSLLLHGSFNYTYNAVNNNEESLNLTDSTNLVSEYSTIFDNLRNDIKQDEPFEIKPSTFETNDDSTYLEKFTDSLKNHISNIFDNFSHEEISQTGFNLSKDSDGAEAVFINYLDSAVSEVNAILNKSDHTKVLVKTSMTATLDTALDTNSKHMESDISLLSNHCGNQKKNLQAQIDTIKERKRAKQEELNKENTDYSKLKSSISEMKDEIDNLERQVVVRKFWTLPTFLKLSLTTLLLLYLSLFFGSAIWKIFFEESEIMKLLSKGITPETPTLFDANSLVKIFSKKGIFYGGIATLFFLIPVLLTSIKLIVPNNKIIEYVVGWLIGIFVIDVVVSILISQHTFEIKRLVTGSTEHWDLNTALKSGEFWMIFIFGALPLFLTKFLIENLGIAYNKSNAESVDREKFLLRNSLIRKVSDNTQEGEVFKTRLAMLNSDMEDISKVITSLEDEKNKIDSFETNKKFEIQERCEKKNKNLRDVYNSFISNVDSGNKSFLQNVVSGRITAFKEGFYLYLTSLYHPTVAGKKIDSLAKAHLDWTKRNFE